MFVFVRNFVFVSVWVCVRVFGRIFISTFSLKFYKTTLLQQQNVYLPTAEAEVIAASTRAALAVVTATTATAAMVAMTSTSAATTTEKTVPVSETKYQQQQKQSKGCGVLSREFPEMLT